MSKIILNQSEEQRILSGHPWVFNNEIKNIIPPIESGKVINVYSANGVFVGKGFLNTASKIMVRILTLKDEIIDYDFFYRRIKQALQYRLDVGYRGSFRVVFGESDQLPGLIIDKYGDYLSIQILSLGMELIKDWIIQICVDLLKPMGIYERSDQPVRLKEGLPEFSGLLYGEVPEEIVIQENGISFYVNIKSGQKTGTFLDQQQNHLAISPYVKDKTVLDCFSHIGSFALHAKKAGAKHVVAIDIQRNAALQIERNAQLNNMDIEVVCGNVFHELAHYQENNQPFDVIVLDPPAFTKTKSKIDNAYKGYLDINTQALKLINQYGYLVSASCTRFMTQELFMQMLIEAQTAANRKCQLVEYRIQGKDHPVLLASDDTMYLKFVILRVLDERKDDL